MGEGKAIKATHENRSVGRPGWLAQNLYALYRKKEVFGFCSHLRGKKKD